MFPLCVSECVWVCVCVCECSIYIYILCVFECVSVCVCVCECSIYIYIYICWEMLDWGGSGNYSYLLLTFTTPIYYSLFTAHIYCIQKCSIGEALGTRAQCSRKSPHSCLKVWSTSAASKAYQQLVKHWRGSENTWVRAALETLKFARLWKNLSSRQGARTMFPKACQQLVQHVSS
jgi:hypothetical protein